MKQSHNVVLFGTDEEVHHTTSLRAGPLDMALRGTKLWHLCIAGSEVWHGVAFVFRDPDWGTPDPIIEHTESTVSEDSFLIRSTGQFPTSPAIDFCVEIEGTVDGCVRFSGEAVPRDDILTNRLGICVLHPMSAGGQRVEVIHTDGRTSRSTLPTLIPAWPPFMLIRAIRHEYAAGRWARCAFTGDAFELEDQRNNSDASFKTYNRSNLMPRPYWLRAGAPVRQSVELRLEAQARRSAPLRSPDVIVSVGDETMKLPDVGVAISPRDAEAGDATREALREMRPAHLHLALDDVAGRVHWQRIKELLEIAGAQLRLDVEVSDIALAESTLNALGDELLDANIVPASIAIFPSENRSIQAARAAFPSSLIGGGTPHFFVQLNRLESLGSVDFLTFTTSPIVHGADDESVMLSLQSLPSMVATLASSYPGLPIRIGPSSIAARRNPLGRQPETDGRRRMALAAQDPRSRGLYGAAWSLGYVAQLPLASVDAITLMSLHGDSGVCANEDGAAVPRHPAYYVLERFQSASRACRVSVSQPSSVAALCLDRNGDRELLLANLTGEAISVAIRGWGESCETSIMDEHTWSGGFSVSGGWSAGRRNVKMPLFRLEPYAIASALAR